MNKNIPIMLLMLSLFLHLPIHSDDMLVPYLTNFKKNIPQNKMIMSAIKGSYADAETLYDTAKEMADSHFFLFLHNDQSQDHLAVYQENFLNECIIAVCSGRSDLLLAMPKKPWSSSFLSSILKSAKNKVYLSDIINSPINDRTEDSLLHLAVRVATEHNSNKPIDPSDKEHEEFEKQYKKIKEVIQLLLRNKANLDARNIDGDTPLHIACKGNDPYVNQLLLEAGANPNIQNNKGNSPIKYISSVGGNASTLKAQYKTAQDKNLWKKKSTQKELDAIAVEDAAINTMAQNQLKQKSTAPNSLNSTPEKSRDKFGQTIYLDNIANQDPLVSTDRTASTNEQSTRSIPTKNKPKTSFGSKGDERPGQTTTKPSRRPKTAGSSRIQIAPEDSTDTFIIDTNTSKSSISTTKTTVRPSTAAKPKAPSSNAPDNYLASRKATQEYTAVSKKVSFSEQKSVTKMSVF